MAHLLTMAHLGKFNVRGMGLNSKTLVDMSKNWETREQIRSKDSRGPQIAYTQNDAFQAGMETQNCIETIDHRSDEDEC
jgi:hypothetical protein